MNCQWVAKEGGHINTPHEFYAALRDCQHVDDSEVGYNFVALARQCMGHLTDASCQELDGSSWSDVDVMQQCESWTPCLRHLLRVCSFERALLEDVMEVVKTEMLLHPVLWRLLVPNFSVKMPNSSESSSGDGAPQQDGDAHWADLVLLAAVWDLSGESRVVAADALEVFALTCRPEDLAVHSTQYVAVYPDAGGWLLDVAFAWAAGGGGVEDGGESVRAATEASCKAGRRLLRALLCRDVVVASGAFERLLLELREECSSAPMDGEAALGAAAAMAAAPGTWADGLRPVLEEHVADILAAHQHAASNLTGGTARSGTVGALQPQASPHEASRCARAVLERAADDSSDCVRCMRRITPGTLAFLAEQADVWFCTFPTEVAARFVTTVAPVAGLCPALLVALLEGARHVLREGADEALVADVADAAAAGVQHEGCILPAVQHHGCDPPAGTAAGGPWRQQLQQQQPAGAPTGSPLCRTPLGGRLSGVGTPAGSPRQMAGSPGTAAMHGGSVSLVGCDDGWSHPRVAELRQAESSRGGHSVTSSANVSGFSAFDSALPSPSAFSSGGSSGWDNAGDHGYSRMQDDRPPADSAARDARQPTHGGAPCSQVFAGGNEAAAVLMRRARHLALHVFFSLATGPTTRHLSFPPSESVALRSLDTAAPHHADSSGGDGGGGDGDDAQSDASAGIANSAPPRRRPARTAGMVSGAATHAFNDSVAGVTDPAKAAACHLLHSLLPVPPGTLVAAGDGDDATGTSCFPPDSHQAGHGENQPAIDRAIRDVASHPGAMFDLLTEACGRLQGLGRAAEDGEAAAMCPTGFTAAAECIPPPPQQQARTAAAIGTDTVGGTPQAGLSCEAGLDRSNLPRHDDKDCDDAIAVAPLSTFLTLWLQALCSALPHALAAGQTGHASSSSPPEVVQASAHPVTMFQLESATSLRHPESAGGARADGVAGSCRSDASAIQRLVRRGAGPAHQQPPQLLPLSQLIRCLFSSLAAVQAGRRSRQTAISPPGQAAVGDGGNACLAARAGDHATAESPNERHCYSLLGRSLADALSSPDDLLQLVADIVDTRSQPQHPENGAASGLGQASCTLGGPALAAALPHRAASASAVAAQPAQEGRASGSTTEAWVSRLLKHRMDLCSTFADRLLSEPRYVAEAVLLAACCATNQGLQARLANRRRLNIVDHGADMLLDAAEELLAQHVQLTRALDRLNRPAVLQAPAVQGPAAAGRAAVAAALAGLAVSAVHQTTGGTSCGPAVVPAVQAASGSGRDQLSLQREEGGGAAVAAGVGASRSAATSAKRPKSRFYNMKVVHSNDAAGSVAAAQPAPAPEPGDETVAAAQPTPPAVPPIAADLFTAPWSLMPGATARLLTHLTRRLAAAAAAPRGSVAGDRTSQDVRLLRHCLLESWTLLAAATSRSKRTRCRVTGADGTPLTTPSLRALGLATVEAYHVCCQMLTKCGNCAVTKSSRWDSGVLCGACGQYAREHHGAPRPLDHPPTATVTQRTGRQPSARHAPAIALASRSVEHPQQDDDAARPRQQQQGAVGGHMSAAPDLPAVAILAAREALQLLAAVLDALRSVRDTPSAAASSGGLRLHAAAAATAEPTLSAVSSTTPSCSTAPGGCTIMGMAVPAVAAKPGASAVPSAVTCRPTAHQLECIAVVAELGSALADGTSRSDAACRTALASEQGLGRSAWQSVGQLAARRPVAGALLWLLMQVQDINSAPDALASAPKPAAAALAQRGQPVSLVKAALTKAITPVNKFTPLAPSEGRSRRGSKLSAIAAITTSSKPTSAAKRPAVEEHQAAVEQLQTTTKPAGPIPPAPQPATAVTPVLHGGSTITSNVCHRPTVAQEDQEAAAGESAEKRLSAVSVAALRLCESLVAWCCDEQLDEPAHPRVAVHLTLRRLCCAATRTLLSGCAHVLAHAPDVLIKLSCGWADVSSEGATLTARLMAQVVNNEGFFLQCVSCLPPLPPSSDPASSASIVAASRSARPDLTDTDAVRIVLRLTKALSDGVRRHCEIAAQQQQQSLLLRGPMGSANATGRQQQQVTVSPSVAAGGAEDGIEEAHALLSQQALQSSIAALLNGSQWLVAAADLPALGWAVRRQAHGYAFTALHGALKCCRQACRDLSHLLSAVARESTSGTAARGTDVAAAARSGCSAAAVAFRAADEADERAAERHADVAAALTPAMPLLVIGKACRDQALRWTEDFVPLAATAGGRRGSTSRLAPTLRGGLTRAAGSGPKGAADVSCARRLRGLRKSADLFEILRDRLIRELTLASQVAEPAIADLACRGLLRLAAAMEAQDHAPALPVPPGGTSGGTMQGAAAVPAAAEQAAHAGSETPPFASHDGPDMAASTLSPAAAWEPLVYEPNPMAHLRSRHEDGDGSSSSGGSSSDDDDDVGVAYVDDVAAAAPPPWVGLAAAPASVRTAETSPRRVAVLPVAGQKKPRRSAASSRAAASGPIQPAVTVPPADVVSPAVVVLPEASVPPAVAVSPVVSPPSSAHLRTSNNLPLPGTPTQAGQSTPRPTSSLSPKAPPSNSLPPKNNTVPPSSHTFVLPHHLSTNAAVVPERRTSAVAAQVLERHVDALSAAAAAAAPPPVRRSLRSSAPPSLSAAEEEGVQQRSGSAERQAVTAADAVPCSRTAAALASSSMADNKRRRREEVHAVPAAATIGLRTSTALASSTAERACNKKPRRRDDQLPTPAAASDDDAPRPRIPPTSPAEVFDVRASATGGVAAGRPRGSRRSKTVRWAAHVAGDGVTAAGTGGAAEGETAVAAGGSGGTTAGGTSDHRKSGGTHVAVSSTHPAAAGPSLPPSAPPNRTSLRNGLLSAATAATAQATSGATASTAAIAAAGVRCQRGDAVHDSGHATQQQQHRLQQQATAAACSDALRRASPRREVHSPRDKQALTAGHTDAVQPAHVQAAHVHRLRPRRIQLAPVKGHHSGAGLVRVSSPPSMALAPVMPPPVPRLRHTVPPLHSPVPPAVNAAAVAVVGSLRQGKAAAVAAAAVVTATSTRRGARRKQVAAKGLRKAVDAGQLERRSLANAYVAACLGEVAEFPDDSEDDESGGYSDLDDFIVCQPERDYSGLLRKRFRYQGNSDQDEVEEDGHRATKAAAPARRPLTVAAATTKRPAAAAAAAVANERAPTDRRRASCDAPAPATAANGAERKVRTKVRKASASPRDGAQRNVRTKAQKVSASPGDGARQISRAKAQNSSASLDDGAQRRTVRGKARSGSRSATNGAERRAPAVPKKSAVRQRLSTPPAEASGAQARAVTVEEPATAQVTVTAPPPLKKAMGRKSSPSLATKEARGKVREKAAAASERLTSDDSAQAATINEQAVWQVMVPAAAPSKRAFGRKTSAASATQQAAEGKKKKTAAALERQALAPVKKAMKQRAVASATKAPAAAKMRRRRR